MAISPSLEARAAALLQDLEGQDTNALYQLLETDRELFEDVRTGKALFVMPSSPSLTGLTIDKKLLGTSHLVLMHRCAP